MMYQKKTGRHDDMATPYITSVFECQLSCKSVTFYVPLLWQRCLGHQGETVPFSAAQTVEKKFNSGKTLM